MCYYPYFRGKQFELITIRETAPLLAKSGFVPIIEPVKEPLGGLNKALTAICEAGGEAIVIVNPYHGDHSENGEGITNLLQEYSAKKPIAAGILLRNGMTLADATKCYEAHKNHKPVLIHAGFTEPKALAEYLGEDKLASRHVFIEKQANILYREHFSESTRILIRDGFERQRNADYTELEGFSELHRTFGQYMNMSGFGDFLIVGDNFSEQGGPAYAVAIHLTFIDPEDDMMYIYHFVSETKDTPTDPAGKFRQALEQLIKKLNSGNSKLLETSTIKEFRQLYAKRHFPGLGYVKKLSMKHHIETLADYLCRE